MLLNLADEELRNVKQKKMLIRDGYTIFNL